MLAIPHNGNLSNGRMFSVETFDGRPLTRELAALRASMEPLIEVTQIKGDGETHPMLSPNGELADYETWDRSNLNGTEAKTPDMIPYEYAREALKNGLKLERSLGVNPFKFGMVGSTNSHTALSTAEEENLFGKQVADLVHATDERSAMRVVSGGRRPRVDPARPLDSPAWEPP